MLTLQGALDKMSTNYTKSPISDDSHCNVSYTLALYNQQRNQSQLCHINDYLGYTFTITYSQVMSCKSCHRFMSKSYFQGLCRSCFFNSSYGAPCILKPEECIAHIDSIQSRCDVQQHTRAHCVYLVHAAKVKVGVTNCATLPTRWIDQGAHRAIILAYTPHRALAGEIEVALKQHYSDRQSWQKMLKGELQNDVNLYHERHKAVSYLSSDLRQYCILDENHVHADQWSHELTEIHYPIQQAPTKVKSLNLDKENVFTGKLQGVRGQYLIFEGGRVFNVRSYSGYHVRFLIEKL